MNNLLHTIFLGFGSNVGDRRAAIEGAMQSLAADGDMALVASSRLYASPAMLPESAPDDWDSEFYNAVARYETSLTPEDVLVRLKAEEQRAGRQVRGKWGPRELDIDLLAYDDLELNTAALTLPHPGIATRDFVLLPWAEIAPEWAHPPVSRLRDGLTTITAKPL